MDTGNKVLLMIVTTLLIAAIGCSQPTQRGGVEVPASAPATQKLPPQLEVWSPGGVEPSCRLIGGKTITCDVTVEFDALEYGFVQACAQRPDFTLHMNVIWGTEICSTNKVVGKMGLGEDNPTNDPIMAKYLGPNKKSITLSCSGAEELHGPVPVNVAFSLPECIPN